MKSLQDETGEIKIVFLTQADKDFLIYMTSDVWITPELRRFKNDLLDRAGKREIKKSSDW